ncbi:MAG TPA: YceI family protein [Gemmatimonadales bacterium]
MSSGTSTPVSPTTNLTQWEIDPSHTSAHFGVRHMMVSTVRGEFTKVSGTVQIDARDLSRSSVHVVIDAASINTRDPQRDAHLRSADFLDVDNHPTIEFDSTRIIRDSGSLKLVGDLTIRGVTREVTLDVEDAGVELKDPWGGVRRGASAKTRVNRKDFGLQWNVALEAGGFVVGDDVRIEIDVELVKKD